MIARISAVWGQRSILRLLVGRDVKRKYADSYLGYLWSILDPLLMAGVFWFIFTIVLPRGGRVDVEPYILFLLVGLLPWNWFNGVVGGAVRAITGESKLVRSTRLPREIWVLRVVGSKFVEFALSVPVVLLFAAVFQVRPSWYVLTLPLAIGLQTLLLVGLGLMVASVSVLVGDVERFIRIFLRILFYMSPVIYSVGNVPADLRWIYALNPLAGIIQLYQAVFYPELFYGWWIVGVSAAISSVLFVAGWAVFSRLESAVLKEL